MRLLKLRNPWGSSEWQGDWSDKSDKWDEKTKAMLNMVDAEDGIFFIPFQDYVEHFRGTAISYESGFSDLENPQLTYKSTTLDYNFRRKPEDEDKQLNVACFQLETSQKIDIRQDFLSISINQQGPRISSYCSQDNFTRFEPSEMNMVLMTAGEGKGVGEILRCQFSRWFQNSIVLHHEKDGIDGQILPKGKYLLFLIPRWNSIAC